VSPLGENQIGQFLPGKAAKKAGLQACGSKISTIGYEKQASLVYLMAAFQNISSQS